MKASYALSKAELDIDRLNSYAIKNIHGTINVIIGRICFSQIKEQSSHTPIKEFCLSIQQAFRGCWKVTHPMKYKKYLMFLMNESIFSHCFLTKRWQDAVKYGVSMDCSQPANQVWAALSAVRCGWEYPAAYVYFWDDLVNRGVSPNLAFVMSAWVKLFSELDIYYITAPFLGGHTVWGFSTFEEMDRIVNGELKSISKPMNLIIPFCNNVQNTTSWNCTRKQVEYQELEKLCVPSRLGLKTLQFDMAKLAEWLKVWEKHNET